MLERIAIVGLNGSGKSTLSHELAKDLNYFEIDTEDFYFPEQADSRKMTLEGRHSSTSNHIGELPYSQPRNKNEVEENILKALKSHQRFILSGVTLNWREEIISSLQKVFWIKVDSKERVKRVKNREVKRWGKRVLEGGDMYEQQLSFRKIIGELSESKVEESLKKMKCDVVELDGSLPVSINKEIIKRNLKEIFENE